MQALYPKRKISLVESLDWGMLKGELTPDCLHLQGKSRFLETYSV